uniref:Uncharacterized protein n=1 Tax=Timema tahoe TaxID=61484 RepID=A0A7R9IAH3_9NEOP|nr:unnamed protein product [Timema tahoe]
MALEEHYVLVEEAWKVDDGKKKDTLIAEGVTEEHFDEVEEGVGNGRHDSIVRVFPLSKQNGKPRTVRIRYYAGVRGPYGGKDEEAPPGIKPGCPNLLSTLNHVLEFSLVLFDAVTKGSKSTKSYLTRLQPGGLYHPVVKVKLGVVRGSRSHGHCRRLQYIRKRRLLAISYYRPWGASGIGRSINHGRSVFTYFPQSFFSRNKGLEFPNIGDNQYRRHLFVVSSSPVEEARSMCPDSDSSDVKKRKRMRSVRLTRYDGSEEIILNRSEKLKVETFFPVLDFMSSDLTKDAEANLSLERKATSGETDTENEISESVRVMDSGHETLFSDDSPCDLGNTPSACSSSGLGSASSGHTGNHDPTPPNITPYSGVLGKVSTNSVPPSLTMPLSTITY